MIFLDAFLNYYVVFDLRLALDFCEVIVNLGSHALTTRAVERGGVPGVTTPGPGPGPKRGPDTKCYKFTSTARYEVKLIAD